MGQGSAFCSFLSVLCLLTSVLCSSVLCLAAANTTNSNDAPGWLTQPLSLTDAIRTALAQNADILKAQHDLEVAHGIALQTRAVVFPKLRGGADYQHDEAVEKEHFVTTSGKPGAQLSQPKDEWSGSVRIVQSIYEGGRMTAAWRAARLVKEQAFQEYQTVLAKTLLNVRTAYYDTLLAEQQINVQDASVKLLEQEFENTKRRLEAGAVPRFNVLRAEVKIANARPRLIKAKNRYRTAKHELATVLGYNIPTNIWEDLPLNLTTKLDTPPYDIALPTALAQARERRPELSALRTEISLHKERVTIAKSGYKPSIGIFGGYGAHNSEFVDDFYRDVAGPVAGVSLSWDIFDGLSTRGKVMEARAREAKAGINFDDALRRVEQEVRTAYSSFIEAREVLASQLKVVEQADEAIRLADARYDAGTGTQLDVLDAQTSLTEARTTQVDAARDYLVARARLERAMGTDVVQEQLNTAPPQQQIKQP
ncbi:MAG TPA: TolC family protein [Verrucomicrobiae bacterium]|jgi:TolC family type I secretion outer membrane protein